MTTLLPHVLDRAVSRLGTHASSTSLGLVAFLTLALLLLERDALAGRRSSGGASTAFNATVLPLVVAVFVMLVVRVLVLAD
jgi:hypothetical protein